MLDKKLKGKEIILASKSPRRNELLKGLDIDFKVITKSIDESFPNDIPSEKVAEYIALKKAIVFDGLSDNQILITADTVVILGDEILGKPNNRDEAFAMLNSLSNKEHTVITGVCIKSNSKEIAFSVSTKVSFKHLTNDEIYYYIDKYQPFDKAGSYGIQEWIGYIGIKSIEGSYYNVMGLPLFELNENLKSFQ